MLQAYPRVLGELDTMRRVVAGESLARYGDGEFKHCAGQRNVSQEQDPQLGARLRGILRDAGACLVGIPNLGACDRMTPEKADFWRRFTSAAQWLAPTRRYVSAFVTRPDSAPWIDTPDYWALVESLWLGQDVTLVRGSSKGLTSEDLMGAGAVTEVICRRQHAFQDYDEILARVGRPRRVLLCLGPTATVLAVELCARGVHAVDLGHIALFLRKHRRGEAMTLTKDDKSHDKAAAV